MTSSLKLFLILYYIKQIDSKLPCVCSVIDHRGCQNVVKTSVTHSAAPHVPLFCSYHILSSSVVYYWTDARQFGIYLLNRAQSWAKAVTPSAKLYYVWSSPGILSAFFFVNWNWNFGTSEPASSNRRTKQRFLKRPGAVIYVIITWAETKILKEKTKWICRVLEVFTLS